MVRTISALTQWRHSLISPVRCADYNVFSYRSLEWNQTRTVSLRGEETWRESEDVVYHVRLYNDRTLHSLDTTEARKCSGVDWEDGHRQQLCYLQQLLPKPFHHDWRCAQEHSVPRGHEPDSRRLSCLLLCSTHSDWRQRSSWTKTSTDNKQQLGDIWVLQKYFNIFNMLSVIAFKNKWRTG